MGDCAKGLDGTDGERVARDEGRGAVQWRAVVVCRVLRRVGGREDAPAAGAVALDDELRRPAGVARVVAHDAPQCRLREREAPARREGTTLSRQHEARRRCASC